MHEECIQMACGWAQPQEVSTTLGNITAHCETRDDFNAAQREKWENTRRKKSARKSNNGDQTLLGCRFPLIRLIRQRILQSLLFKCYFFYLLPKETITPFINTAAHYQHTPDP